MAQNTVASVQPTPGTGANRMELSRRGKACLWKQPSFQTHQGKAASPKPAALKGGFLLLLREETAVWRKCSLRHKSARMSTARTENADPLRWEAGQLRSFRELREEGRPGSLGSSLRIYQRRPPNRPGDLGSLSEHGWGWLYQRAGPVWEEVAFHSL